MPPCLDLGMPVRHHGRMAEGKDWDRLAEFARERRVELGMTQEDVRAAGGPSTATMRLIEGALQQGYQPATLRDLEKVFRWERGSAARILAGGEPAELSVGPAPGRPALLEFGDEDLPDDEIPPQQLAAFQDYADEFTVRYALARRRYPGQRLTGDLVFPRNPLHAQLWDMLASLGWKTEAIPRSMAAMLVLRDEQSPNDRETGSAAGLTLAGIT